MPLGANDTKPITTAPYTTSRQLSHWCPMTFAKPISAAPKTAPATRPLPPSTTISKKSTESATPTASGFTSPRNAANIAPPAAASPAAIANASTLYARVGTPIASAASSSLRIASHARPMRERRMNVIFSTATSTTNHAPQYAEAPVNVTAPSCGYGTFVIPLAPPNHGEA